MNALDRLVFSIALLLTLSGSIALYAEAKEAVRQASACQKMQLQVAVYGGL